eukprot:6407076-Amphidinium_carterae.3
MGSFKFEQLHRHGAHLSAAAIVLPGLHTPNEIKIDIAANTRYDTNKPTTIVSSNERSIGEVEDINQQANIPKHLRQPPQPVTCKARTGATSHYTHVTCHIDLGAQCV